MRSDVALAAAGLLFLIVGAVGLFLYPFGEHSRTIGGIVAGIGVALLIFSRQSTGKGKK